MADNTGTSGGRNTADQMFADFSNSISKLVGKPQVFFACVLVVLIWAGFGPATKYSDTWQLIINTSTTIITFLMVFLIQSTQNRDSAALHAKLDALIRFSDADNKFIGIEHLGDKELDSLLEEVEQYAEELHRQRRKRHTKKKA